MKAILWALVLTALGFVLCYSEDLLGKLEENSLTAAFKGHAVLRHIALFCGLGLLVFVAIAIVVSLLWSLIELRTDLSLRRKVTAVREIGEIKRTLAAGHSPRELIFADFRTPFVIFSTQDADAAPDGYSYHFFTVDGAMLRPPGDLARSTVNFKVKVTTFRGKVGFVSRWAHKVFEEMKTPWVTPIGTGIAAFVWYVTSFKNNADLAIIGRNVLSRDPTPDYLAIRGHFLITDISCTLYDPSVPGSAYPMRLVDKGFPLADSNEIAKKLWFWRGIRPSSKADEGVMVSIEGEKSD
jgi:hypothetical protein